MSLCKTSHRHPRRAIVLASGGLDSTVLAYWMVARGTEVMLLSLDYGQRHRVELEYAGGVAGLLQCSHDTLDISEIGRMLLGSVLTDTTMSVPDGRHADGAKHVFVVPNRNAIMLNIAAAIAAARDVNAVAFGARAGSRSVYPDCRPEVIDRYTKLVRVANRGLLNDGFEILAPLLTLERPDIIRIGVALGVPFEQTWSCYRGGQVHCGRCRSCIERRESFQRTEILDPTAYQEVSAG